MSQIVGADNSVLPGGEKARPHFASLKQTATLSLTTPTSATILTDADAWTAGAYDPAPSAGGITVSATAGTFTIGKAGNYRVSYGQSGLTVVNGQVLTAEVYKGSTASGGKCSQTQLTSAPASLNGSFIIACSVGDVLSIKVTADTGNYTSAAGFIVVEEV